MQPPWAYLTTARLRLAIHPKVRVWCQALSVPLQVAARTLLTAAAAVSVTTQVVVVVHTLVEAAMAVKHGQATAVVDCSVATAVPLFLMIRSCKCHSVAVEVQVMKTITWAPQEVLVVVSF